MYRTFAENHEADETGAAGEKRQVYYNVAVVISTISIRGLGGARGLRTRIDPAQIATPGTRRPRGARAKR